MKNKNVYEFLAIGIVYLYFIVTLINKKTCFLGRYCFSSEDNPFIFTVFLVGLIGVIFCALLHVIQATPVKKALKVILILLLLYGMTIFILGFFPERSELDKLLNIKVNQFKHMTLEDSEMIK